MDTATTANAANRPGEGCFRRVGRWTVRVLVVVFVCWHLFAVLVRNSIDLFASPLRNWLPKDEQPWKSVLLNVNEWTSAYENLTGCEQNWGMFSTNLARSAAFLAARIEFDDGSTELVCSLNEPDPLRYFRLDGARLRMLEAPLSAQGPDGLPDSSDLPVYAAYVRWSVRRWHAQAPEDPRKPVRVELIARLFQFPGPGDDPRAVWPVRVRLVGAFNPQGKLLP